MQSKPAIVLSFVLASLAITGCSKQEATPAAGVPAAAADAPAAAPAAAQHASACDLITAAEMSAILGGSVQASAGGNERPPTATECIYQSANASTTGSGLDEVADPSKPYAEVEVDWGGGDPEVLGASADLANGAATVDAANPLKGLGDRAYTVTADQVFISTHGNLMQIRFARRSEDAAAKARKIFETAQPRM